MLCPFCGENQDRVVDSRETRDGLTIRRRRECVICNRRFTSYERIEDIPFMVVKTDGTREEFDRAKLLSGLSKACEKRPVSTASLDEIVTIIEKRLHDSEDREVATTDIGSIIMERLRELDQVAYVRFASVYRKFEDIEEFLQEARELLTKKS